VLSGWVSIESRTRTKSSYPIQRKGIMPRPHHSRMLVTPLPRVDEASTDQRQPRLLVECSEGGQPRGEAQRQVVPTTAANKSIDPNDAATRTPAVFVKSGSI
jgi:hypothetical protein